MMFKIGDTFTITADFRQFVAENSDETWSLPIIGEQGEITAVGDKIIGVLWKVHNNSIVMVNLDLDDALALLEDTHKTNKPLLDILAEYLDLNGVQEQLQQPGYTWISSSVIERLSTLTKTEFEKALKPALRDLGYGSELHYRDVAGMRVMLKVWEID